MLYFAYGSNMLSARLRGRAPSARFIGRAVLGRHELRIHKRARDGSAKCDAFFTGLETDRVHGVLFALDDGDWESLDRAEGRGNGYQRVEIEVVAEAPAPHSEAAQMYVAQASHIDAELLPFTWYRDIVVAGAREHGLPPEYIARIAVHPATPAPP